MINRIKCNHYKGFRSIDLSVGNYNVLVGPNAGGKSSFFDIILFINDILNNDIEKAVIKRCADFSELTWNQKSRDFELTLEIKITSEDSSDFSVIQYSITPGYVEGNGIIIKDENLRLSEYLFHPSDFSTSEDKDDRNNTKSKEWRNIIQRKLTGQVFFESEEEIHNFQLHLQIPNKKSALNFIPNEDKFPLLSFVSKTLCENIRFIQLDCEKMKWPCRPDSPFKLQANGQNLPKVLKNLKNYHKQSFELWLDHIRTALPDVRDIGVIERPEDRFLYLYIDYEENPRMPSWLLSDGTLRLLALTVIPYLPEKNNIYFIEEPENGLHPQATESVIQSLSSVYENQIFIATHSPVILRLSVPEEILCFSKSQDGSINIIRGEQHPFLIDWQDGVNIADLHATGVL